MLAPVTHFLAVTIVRRTRLLPVPGHVVVRKGQKVSATDVVAEATLAPEHILLDIARGLNVPLSKADQHILLKAGDEVGEGDVVAGPVGFARRVVRAPKPGRVVVAGGGQVLLELESKPFELKAGLPGVVTELYNDRGVDVETTGSLVQGVWGNGAIAAGLLTVLAQSAGDTLTPDRLDVSHRGSVIFGGYCGSPEVLTTAAEIPLRGLVLSSMDPDLKPTAEKLSIPVVLIEGFGQLPLNTAAYKVLSTNDRREIALNAERWDKIAGTRPEVVIPLPASGVLPLEAAEYAVGKQVHVVAPPYKGMIGTLAAIHLGLTRLPSGVKAHAADVRLENGETVLLPVANLEVLE